MLLSCGFRPLAVEARNPLGLNLRSNSSAPPYRDSLVSLHKSLVDFNSTTDSEAAVGQFLIDYLTKRGFVAERQTLPSSNTSAPRFNVIAWPDSRKSNSSKVVVTSHIDTVPPYIPYSRTGPEPPTAETVIAGRGTVDAKGSVATQVTALLELLSAGAVTGDDVMLAFVVGEERTGDGMMYFSNITAQQPDPPKAAIFGEPTEGRLACGHKGSLSCTVTAHGRSGHSGYPWLFKSATEVLMRAMVQTIDTDLGTSERYGNTTVNVGLLSGGTAVNVVADIAMAAIVVRVGIGPELEGGEIVKGRLLDLLTSVDDEAFDFECGSRAFGAIECNCDVDGFETTVVNYGTDIPSFKGNHTRYLYGPGSILVSHGPNEAITLGELETAVEDYKRLILHAVQS
ncbi:Zn-dependent exopeptidase [Xylariaceae sp. AK1471]|nr:Zn-dependent exopeptidase [Xylariaceae sp. AK1471]